MKPHLGKPCCLTLEAFCSSSESSGDSTQHSPDPVLHVSFPKIPNPRSLHCLWGPGGAASFQLVPGIKLSSDLSSSVLGLWGKLLRGGSTRRLHAEPEQFGLESTAGGCCPNPTWPRTRRPRSPPRCFTRGNMHIHTYHFNTAEFTYLFWILHLLV